MFLRTLPDGATYYSFDEAPAVSSETASVSVPAVVQGSTGTLDTADVAVSAVDAGTLHAAADAGGEGFGVHHWSEQLRVRSSRRPGGYLEPVLHAGHRHERDVRLG